MRAWPSFPLGGGLDTLPPEQALRRVCRGARPFLLDGAAASDGLGRYSYAGCDPRARHRVRDVPELSAPPHVEQRFTSDTAQSRVAVPPALLRTLETELASWQPLVAVGLLGYELGRALECLPRHARPDDTDVAAIDFAGYDALYRFDAETGRADLLAVDGDAAARLRRVLHAEPPPLAPLPAHTALRPDWSRADYGRRVGRIAEALHAGDCYQVNLCHRLRAALPQAATLTAYLRLRTLAPAPLGFYLELEDDRGARGPVLLSNTPELLLRIGRDGEHGRRTLETRPIKGTRPRGRDAAEDRALAAALERSAKDAAEHLMIVDLLRNDLGRVARGGSVRVEGLLRRVELPTVHHLISTVLAEPLPEAGLAEVLHALLPGGSITGAPKLAAMTLIDELEPLRRGPFYGAVGWLGGGGGDLALCIRTAVVRRDELVLSVGGGIVLDSTADEEWRETEAKAAAFRRALGG